MAQDMVCPGEHFIHMPEKYVHPAVCGAPEAG